MQSIPNENMLKLFHNLFSADSGEYLQQTTNREKDPIVKSRGGCENSGKMNDKLRFVVKWIKSKVQRTQSPYMIDLSQTIGP